MNFVTNFLKILTTGGMLAVCLGYGGAIHPALDSIGHFRFQMIALTAIPALLLAFTGSWRLGVFSILLLLVPLIIHMQASLYSGRLELPEEGARYRFMQINVRFDTHDTKEALRVIARNMPDVISVQEATNRWQKAFETIRSAYPYQLQCTSRGKVGGVMIISRRPFVEHVANSCNDAAGLLLQAIDLNGRKVLAGSIHLFWPWPYKQAQHVDSMIGPLKKARASGLPLLIGGDMNAATWSYSLRRISKASGGQAAAYSGGSWAPIEFPDWAATSIGLPLDNFIFGNLLTGHVQKMERTGSDHLPLMIEFGIPPGDSVDVSKAQI